jgi:alpha-amylase/alpha-mannosidase (GH57 family)
MSGKLSVAFLWHMHQPFYRDPAQGKYILPWVRLHGIKGYTDMLEAVRRNGQVRVTFNFSPCLLKQLFDLTNGGETDLYADLSAKSPQDLEVVEKKLLLRHFFAANWDTMVLRYPRYRDLLYRRGRQVFEPDLEAALRRFTNQDFTDLQVWFNLTWFGWACEERYALISQLKRKGHDFSTDDKQQVLELQQQVLDRLLPEYAAAWKEGLIEISISPFYHPILPLLIDNYSARISQPQDPMPQAAFRRPAEAREQLQRGLDYAQDKLGLTPVGLWPSEGSVSPATCELAHQVGFQWLATDEAVLLGTLGHGPREEVIYQSYRAFDDGPTIFFRDRYLSDAIGFRYARNTPKGAVDDFVGHLENIARQHVAQASPPVASVILDGENAWEYFQDGGRGFFEELYGRLANHPQLTTTTMGGFTQELPAKDVLPPIFPASWINGSFRIWIGDPIKNRAWDRLKQTADLIEECSGVASKKKAVARARDYLLVAEGSDWFWWYGEPNSSDFDLEFDQLFRLNQIEIYKVLGSPVPEELARPLAAAPDEAQEQTLFPMQPVIDGLESTYYEWLGARVVRASDYSGSMYMSSSLLSGLYYGISAQQLFLRLDPAEAFRGLKNVSVVVRFVGPGQSALEITNLNLPGKLKGIWISGETKQKITEVAYQKILETAIDFDLLPRLEDEVHFAVIIMNENLEIERWPRMGSFSCPWPTEAYFTGTWVI